MFSRSDYFTESKLSILYLLDKAGIHLTAEQVLECMSENKIMNYFDVSQALTDLCDSGLVYIHDENNIKSYSCSNAGKTSLGEFRVRIPASVREQIDNYISDNLRKLRRENEHFADCIRMPDGSYVARLMAHDDDNSEIDIAITVPSRESAEVMCKRWIECAGDIYKYIIESLSDPR